MLLAQFNFNFLKLSSQKKRNFVGKTWLKLRCQTVRILKNQLKIYWYDATGCRMFLLLSLEFRRMMRPRHLEKWSKEKTVWIPLVTPMGILWDCLNVMDLVEIRSANNITKCNLEYTLVYIQCSCMLLTEMSYYWKHMPGGKLVGSLLSRRQLTTLVGNCHTETCSESQKCMYSLH